MHCNNYTGATHGACLSVTIQMNRNKTWDLASSSGEYRVVSRPPWRYNLTQYVLGLCWGLLPVDTCLEHLSRETSKEHHHQMPKPPELAPPTISTLSLSQMAELLSLPLKETRGGSSQPLVSVMSFFQSLHTVGYHK